MNAKEHLTGVMVEFEGVIGEGAGRARGGRGAGGRPLVETKKQLAVAVLKWLTPMWFDTV